jgi:hypothetical protein
VAVLSNGTTAGTSNVKSLAIAGGATPTATLDLADNAMVVDYTGPSPLATIKAQVGHAYDGGTWAEHGITSSQADASQFGVGYAEASALGGVPTIFGTVDADAVLLRLTRYGDANLDGQVNLQDFNRLASGFGAGDDWSEGDFNYDGLVNLQDFNRLAANFGLGAAGPGVTPQDWAMLGAAVPEPGGLGMLLLGGFFAARRRRTRRHCSAVR